jgi:opacity protein-like surface antigen
MQSNTTSSVRLLATAICAAPLLAMAGPSVAEPIVTAPAPNPWEFRITPLYGWLTALEGTTGPDGFTANVDESFSDILDVLKMYASLQMEARYDHWGFLADGFYACLGNSGHSSGPLNEDVDLELTQFLGEFDVLYRVSETPTHFVDMYAGVRYNSLELELELKGKLKRSASASRDWADPIAGLRGQWNINDRWYLAGKGDIGGFGVSSNLTWNLQGTVGYNFTRNFSTEIGYRYFDTDYDESGFTYDMAEKGVLINFVFKF